MNASVSQAIKHANKFVFRYDAEYNYALTQLIPYVVVTNSKEDKLYVAERTAGDERLINKFELGSSGHINPCDISDNDTIRNAAKREMNEELKIELNENTDLCDFGTVRDIYSSTRDHLGIVFLAHSDNVSVREKESLCGRWMALSELVDNYEKFENWARFIIDYLFLNYKQYGRLFVTENNKKQKGKYS